MISNVTVVDQSASTESCGARQTEPGRSNCLEIDGCLDTMRWRHSLTANCAHTCPVAPEVGRKSAGVDLKFNGRMCEYLYAL